MEIAVYPDERVVVKAPKGTSEDEIQSKVKKRARLLTKQLSYFHQFNPRTPQRRYGGGETHLYLGRQYRLKIKKGGKSSVKLTRGFFWITYEEDKSSERIKQLLDDWYLKKAKEKFYKEWKRCITEFKRFGLSEPNIHIRRIKTRWGSLSPKGTLTLNIDLIRAPKDCIEYVITHELCHLKYHDHGPEFYKMLEQLMPDWERRKHNLELALI